MKLKAVLLSIILISVSLLAVSCKAPAQDNLQSTNANSSQSEIEQHVAAAKNEYEKWVQEDNSFSQLPNSK